MKGSFIIIIFPNLHHHTSGASKITLDKFIMDQHLLLFYVLVGGLDTRDENVLSKQCGLYRKALSTESS